MKKKAAIIILTALLIVSFHHSIYSQIYRYHSQRTMVMATNGLNMRSEPTTTSTKLVNIPFGEKVRILHKDHYGLDTIYTIKSQLRDHPVYGYWQKVSYGAHTGYVHNAFLSMESDHYEYSPEDTNQDFIFLKPGYDCGDEFVKTDEYFWYGFYQETNANGQAIGKAYRRVIEVNFINTADEMTGSGTIVKEDRHLKFIIGSKKVLPETKMDDISEKALFERLDDESIRLDSTVALQGNIAIVDQEHGDAKNEDPLFYLCHDGQEQQINKETKLINRINDKYRIFMGHQYIEADLDGDGKLDYIFGHRVYGGHYGLYLSSEADEDQVAKLVSVFARGPCC